MARAHATLWRHRDFLTLWTGQTISLVGSQVTLLALPLTAVLSLRADAFQMGLLRAAQYAPALLIALPVGAYVDRRRRRPILMAADLGRALLLGAIPLAAALGALSIGLLDGVAFLVGALSVVFEAAYLAFLPALVRRDQLVDANGKLGASDSAARLVGPGLGGLLVQALTAPLAITADAASFLFSVLFLALLRDREPAPARAPRRALGREIGEGLRLLLGHPLLRATLFSSGITNFFSAIFNALFVLYAVRQLGLGAAGLGGILLAASAVGLVVALCAGRAAARLGLGPVMVLGMLLIALGGAVVPLVAGLGLLAIPALTLAMAATASGDALYNVTVVSLRQGLTPDRLLGRVGAGARFIIWGAQPFGAVLGGALGQSLGLRPALAMAAAGWFLAFLCLLLSPVRRVRAQPVPVEQPTPDAVTVPELGA
jgi:hypothetical protein